MRKKCYFLFLAAILWCAPRLDKSNNLHACSLISLSKTPHLRLITQELALLDSWLATQYYAPLTVSLLRHQIYEEILDLHHVDKAEFEQYIEGWIPSSLEQTKTLYTALYTEMSGWLNLPF